MNHGLIRLGVLVLLAITSAGAGVLTDVSAYTAGSGGTPAAWTFVVIQFDTSGQQPPTISTFDLTADDLTASSLTSSSGDLTYIGGPIGEVEGGRVYPVADTITPELDRDATGVP